MVVVISGWSGLRMRRLRAADTVFFIPTNCHNIKQHHRIPYYLDQQVSLRYESVWTLNAGPPASLLSPPALSPVAGLSGREPRFLKPSNKAQSPCSTSVYRDVIYSMAADQAAIRPSWTDPSVGRASFARSGKCLKQYHVPSRP